MRNMLKYLPNLVICRVEQILQKMRLPPELVSEKTKIKMKRETGRPENRGQQGTLLRMSLHSKLHRSYNQRRNRKRKTERDKVLTEAGRPSSILKSLWRGRLWDSICTFWLSRL